MLSHDPAIHCPMGALYTLTLNSVLRQQKRCAVRILLFCQSTLMGDDPLIEKSQGAFCVCVCGYHAMEHVACADHWKSSGSRLLIKMHHWKITSVQKEKENHLRWAVAEVTMGHGVGWGTC
jgi:hypothetical protein